MLAALAVAALVFTHITVRGDLGELLPHANDPAARLVDAELRTGTAASLLLLGIEGAPAGTLAGISNRLSDRLSHDPGLLFVQNGRRLVDPEAARTLFAARYLLASQGAEAFSVIALHADFLRLRDGLASSASPLVQQYGMPDPTGALPALLGSWTGGGRAILRDGVWFAPGAAPRALLLARLIASGTDLPSQARTLGRLRSDFHAIAGRTSARLLVTGAPVFAEAAEAAVRRDVRLLSIVSALLVAAWLSWRFRSPWVLAAIATSVAIGLSSAALAVQLAFGFVHGITLGFGMTMLGITIDYPVLLVGHRKQGEPAPATIRRIARPFTLSVLTASLGLSGMAGSRFPGVAQLGLFAAIGILASAAATRWLLPGLIERAGLAPSYAGDPGRLDNIERWRRWRLWGVVPPLLAVLGVALAGGPRLDHDLAGLAPVPRSLLALDASLRAQLGGPDIGQLGLVRAATADAVLQAQEAIAPALDALVARRAITGAEDAARLLPSAALQRARQRALPDDATLRAAIARAADGLGFTSHAFDAFAADVAQARTRPPLTAGELPGSLLRTRLDALLFQRDGAWFGPVIPAGIADPVAVAAVFVRPGLVFIDVRRTTQAVVRGYTRQAWPFVAGGASLAVLVLLLGQRDPSRSLRVLAAIASTLLVTLAALVLSGTRLTLIHLVSLQFVAGIGLDYALFFARPQLDAEERARTLRTLLTCNVMALLTFSLLCLCRTPLLREIGGTVCIGVVLAMGFGFLFAGERPAYAARSLKTDGSA
nr:MMPL family transporter [uncultured Lichenicoccus sp.]